MEVRGQRHAPAALTPGKNHSYFKEAGWTPQPIWPFWRSDNSGIRTSDRPARRLITTPTALFTAVFSKHVASLSRRYWSIFYRCFGCFPSFRFLQI